MNDVLNTIGNFNLLLVTAFLAFSLFDYLNRTKDS
jgi:hypothetical protein